MSAVVFNQADARKIMRLLEQVSRKVAVKHLRIGLNAWGGLVREVAQNHARQETGLLKKSLAVKVVIPDASYNKKHHGKPARVMVGADRKTVRALLSRPGRDKLLSDRKALKTVLGGGKVRVRKPSRYAHLVEQKEPFIAPASKAGEAVGFAKLADKLQQGLEQEVAAAAKP